MGVITARNGEVVEDASEDYLKLCASGQTPVPLVIDLMDEPGQLGKSGWRTVLTLPERGGGIIGGTLRPESKVRDYFDTWHTYPDNPVKPQVTSGAQIEAWSHTVPLSPAHEVPNPAVTEARRLLITRDVMIGDGPREHCFADGVPVHNVWHTLWRTQPVREYSVNRRNHFFQIDPDSPLAVFLWQIDIAMKEDLPNHGFQVAALQSRRSRAWALRSDANTLRSGQWDQPDQPTAPVSNGFGMNAYAAFLDSPLGGAAVFSLTDGLIVRTTLPKRSNVQVIVPAEAAPRRKGEVKQVNLLILGIPRRCALTETWPPSTNVVERFYRDFALDGGHGGYTVRLDRGTLLSRRYILSVDGRPSGGMSGQLEGKLISSLPISVSGLSDRWSALLYDRRLKQSRPVGVLEGAAWATINLAGRADLFVGHPLRVDSPDLFMQLTQSGEDAWTLEIHNPTDAPITTRIRPHPDFDPLKGKGVSVDPVVIPPGESWTGIIAHARP